MYSDDDDLFAISDDDILSARIHPAQLPNPVEEQLLKQLNDVQDRIDAATNEIQEVKITTGHILNALKWRAFYGEGGGSDSDSDMYNAEGEPVAKIRRREASNAVKNLEVVSQWQCVLQDKWIIGAELRNMLQCALHNLRCYPCVKDEPEIHGEYTFWQSQQDQSWKRINSISPGTVQVMVILVLDLPTFDRDSTIDCWSTIFYESGETQLQMPMSLARLTAIETIDNSWRKLFLVNQHGAILSLKSTSKAERYVNVWLARANEQNERRAEEKRFFRFLVGNDFEKIHGDVFVSKTQGSLMYCLIELLSSDIDQTRMRIFARSVNQLNIMMHLLQEQFSKVTVVEDFDCCLEAANALISELKTIRDKKSLIEIQKAKLTTDLLIP